MMASGRSGVIARSGAFTGLPAWVKSPALRCWNARGCNSISAGAAIPDGASAGGDQVKAENTKDAAKARRTLDLIASSMAYAPKRCGAPNRRAASTSVVRVLGRRRFQRALHLGRDRLRRLDLLHQVVVPGSLDLEVGR